MRSLRALLCAVVGYVGVGLGLCAVGGATPPLGLAAGHMGGASPAARNLPLTTSVRASLVAAAAALHGLPASTFLGLAPANQGYAAYYGYDSATSTYWAAGSLVPNPKSQEAGVVVQDDGAYLIFHRAANGPWRVQDAGYSDVVGACAAYHVNIPAAVVAVWHWVAGTCHPPAATASAATTTPKATRPLGGVALARHEWLLGASADDAQQGEYWVRAATALAAQAGDTQADRRAATRLRQLASLPDAQESSAQQTEGHADVTALNAFFATNGLYGVNAPSTSTAAFVATLQAEARIGTLSANEPHANGAIPGPLAGASVHCPVLASLGAGSLFGCTLSHTATGSYLLVGSIEAPHGTTYIAEMLSVPVSHCPDLDLAQQAVVKKLGGVCE
jgi:hypothetical protein